MISPQISQLYLYVNDHDEPLESRDEYILRVKKHLPNFPEDVIAQWFFEHQSVVDQWKWLNYSTLSFTSIDLSITDFELPCLEKHETVVQYRDHFLCGSESPRMNLIAEFMTENGTWPCPPLILHNSYDNVIAPWGYRYSSPYDIIEGHHRFAILYSYLKKKRYLKPKHNVWLVKN
jgi:hypothetical protein